MNISLDLTHTMRVLGTVHVNMAISKIIIICLFFVAMQATFSSKKEIKCLFSLFF